MRLDFYKEEWDKFEQNCGFTDDELNIVHLMRRGWYLTEIAAELYISLSTAKRRKRSIENKIIHYIAFN